MQPIVVTPEFCLKAASLLDDLIAVIQEQSAELIQLKAAKVSVVELQKVASVKPDTRELQQALIDGGMTHTKAASLCAEFRESPTALAEFSTKVIRNLFNHASADGHGVPKSASVSSSTTVPAGPFE